MLGKLLRYTLLHAITPAVFLTAGWYSGAKYGAPAIYLNAVDTLVDKASALAAPLLGKAGEAASNAAESGGEYIVGTVAGMAHDDDETAASENDEVASRTAQSTAAGSSSGAISLCGGMRVSNAPSASNGVLGTADAIVRYRGVSILRMPATNSCFSSGYGSRNRKLHRGVDYYTDTGGNVLAAGDGVIVEAINRSDYGNMIVIDHGGGAYTRYAHLARFAGGVRKGASVNKGQTLGPIGKSGQAGVVHLHYELLTGNIASQAGSFGLEPVDLFALR